MALTWVCWWGEWTQSERRGWEEETSGFSSPVTSSPMKIQIQKYKNTNINTNTNNKAWDKVEIKIW